jgi:homoserine kinase
MAVTVQVPASTTNLGPGFDCFGVALKLSNHITIDLEITGRQLPIVEEAAALFFNKTGTIPIQFDCRIEGNVPQARGLGSSVTVRAGVLVALNNLLGTNVSRETLCHFCSELEGHPDNAAAAIFGGFAIVNKKRNRVDRFEVKPDLKFVLFIPGFEVKTNEARKVVPASFSRQAVVENLANASLIAAAFASGDYERLRQSFSDQIHQPYRQHLVPFLPNVLQAAEEAGALGGFLSGSGSTIACVTLSNEQKVAGAIASAAPEARGKTLIVTADNLGARIDEPGSLSGFTKTQIPSRDS